MPRSFMTGKTLDLQNRRDDEDRIRYPDYWSIVGLRRRGGCPTLLQAPLLCKHPRRIVEKLETTTITISLVEQFDLTWKSSTNVRFASRIFAATDWSDGWLRSHGFSETFFLGLWALVDCYRVYETFLVWTIGINCARTDWLRYERSQDGVADAVRGVHVQRYEWDENSERPQSGSKGLWFGISGYIKFSRLRRVIESNSIRWLDQSLVTILLSQSTDHFGG